MFRGWQVWCCCVVNEVKCTELCIIKCENMVGVTDVSFNDCDDIHEGVLKITLHTVMKTKLLLLHT